MSIQFNHKPFGSVIGSGTYVFRHYGDETPVGPPNNEIWYTTTDNQVNTLHDSYGGTTLNHPSSTYFGATMISNTYSNGKGIITFDGDVTKIDGYLDYMMPFSCFSDNLASITLPASVTSLNNGSFAYLTNISSITIPDTITELQYGVFCYNTAITSISIPESVTKVGSMCCDQCTNLISVYVNAIDPPNLDSSSAFSGNASGRKIYVPAESVDAYKTATNWSTYADDIVAQS